MWQIYTPIIIILKYARCYLAALCIISMFFIGYSLFVSEQTSNSPPSQLESSDCKYYLPKVKIFGIKKENKALTIVEQIFQKLGYTVQIGGSSDWDILWSYTYPFHSLAKELSTLQPFQKINHFPGSGYITQKSNLAALQMDYIPKSFILPMHKELFMKYADTYGQKSWILKSSSHRGMKLINRTVNLDANDVFIQEFIQDPLLIHGKKFDIGVYVMLTSIDPLRLYIYSEDILLRFCKKDYYPLNADLPESYIVGDDYLPIWEIPDLQFYYSELNYTAKETLNTYLKHQGKNVKKLWYHIHEAIKNVYIKTEDKLKQSVIEFGHMRQFFELVRFDFLADKDLNVFLLEVNMSPNLSPAHFPQNSLLYEQIVFNSLSLVGFIRKFPETYVYRGEAEVSEKDIQVFSEECSSKNCQLSCENPKCIVCNQCMSSELKEVAKSAYLEFMNRGKYRRLLPSHKMMVKFKQVQKFVQLSEMNTFMDKWFHGKCSQDITWCY